MHSYTDGISDEIDDTHDAEYMPERIEYTPEQSAIIDFIKYETGHLIIDSPAGSGKSFLANEIAKILGEEFYTMGLSFSHIGVKQLTEFDYALTSTALGNAVMGKYFWSDENRGARKKAYRNNSKFDKYNWLTNKVVKENADDLSKSEYTVLRKLVDMVRSTNALTDDQWMYAWQLVSDEEYNPELAQLAKQILLEGIFKFKSNKTLDYTDCIWLPTELNATVGGRLYKGNEFVEIEDLEWILIVDEYQDMSESELRLILRFAEQFESRLIFVGDKNQAIYGWRGASGNASKLITDILPDIKTLNITKTFRCPRSHCEYIMETMDPRFVIEAYHDREGDLHHTNSVEEALEHVDFSETVLVTARNFNGKESKIIPAMRYVLDKTDKTIRVEGFNLSSLTNTLLNVVQNNGLSLTDLDTAINIAIIAEEIKTEQDANYFCNFKELRDELDFAKLIIGMCVECETAAQAKHYIKYQLNDPNADIVFSTVFRIKGETYKSVILLDPVVRTRDNAHKDINEQEKNILFVGLSRATDILVLVYYPQE